MALFHSFLWLSSRPLSRYATLSVSNHLSIIIYNVPCLDIVTSAAMNIEVHVAFLVLSRYVP